jgi:hypothetical protein
LEVHGGGARIGGGLGYFRLNYTSSQEIFALRGERQSFSLTTITAVRAIRIPEFVFTNNHGWKRIQQQSIILLQPSQTYILALVHAFTKWCLIFSR